MRTRLKFFLAGAEVSRYHTIRTLQSETVGHHSHGVAMLCYLIDPNASRELILAALAHDMAEQHLGDMPAPAKLQYGIGEMVNEVEKNLLKGSGFYVEISANDYRTLKLADIAQGALFCVREMQLGNVSMQVIFDRYMSYADKLIPVGNERELFDTISEIHRRGSML